ncbi:maleylpyruvate isomerase family mycothiol-dependent enzyme [Streptomyces violascens]|uniref:Mycothiol-dependent maleylpyruvate isomerase metal-binding domain-containing protein n=1 Tax=Streptomyces violascens TaxID=67381 RepID=A0ABQ3QSN7_9ACTN|nr:maleylpyruvate isomerase family mycothiol-dependent enzyme [Streptomyces violascens]GGU33568.1 hypothetical protein GCM10010289_63550 [Streptomyces violascens]GHI40296.1 hypothetical protein Sviol_47040 [Streptomyces violascens]
MTDTAAPAQRARPIDRTAAATLAAEEYDRFTELARSLAPEDWHRQTDCADWDVRAMTGHVLGMMDYVSSVRQFLHTRRAGSKAAHGRPVIDGVNEVQVTERASLTVPQLLDALARTAPKAARARRRLPAPARRIPMRVEFNGIWERWTLGYLYDVILTRDTWMHRIDMCRATGRPLRVTPEHDGRIVADVVAEWARRHGRPFTLVLTGPAGGTFAATSAGQHLSADAIEFCRVVSGRGAANGLLGQPVPF